MRPSNKQKQLKMEEYSMKKLTALLLALALGLSLTACGGTNDAQDKETDSKTDTAQTDQSAQTGVDDQDKADDAKTEDKQEDTSKDDAATQEPQAPAQTAPTPTPSQPAQSTTTTAPSQTPAASAPAAKPETSAPAQNTPAPEPATPTAADASKYIGSTASALQGAIGAPSSKSYSPSCMGDGEDGVWTYDGFSVYTYRENGTETVEAVQ